MRYVSAARFRTDCARLRLLAMLTAACIAIALLLAWLVPVLRGAVSPLDPRFGAHMIRYVPDLCYIAGILFVGQAMGRLSHGRALQPTLASALRLVGWALGIGGVLAVFVVPNVLRWLLGTRGGYLAFDVGSMTLAIVGGALVLLGYVVDQALRVQGELDQMF